MHIQGAESMDGEQLLGKPMQKRRRSVMSAVFGRRDQDMCDMAKRESAQRKLYPGKANRHMVGGRHEQKRRKASAQWNWASTLEIT